jgi:hypothetical protein
MNGIPIQLSHEDLSMARSWGRRRFQQFGTFSSRDHALTVAAEIAVARLLGMLSWRPSSETFEVPEHGLAAVRVSTEHNGRVRVFADDPDKAIIIHVTGMPPDLVVRGWMPALLAKNPAWAKGDGFEPPEAALREMVKLGIPLFLSESDSRHIICAYERHRASDWRLPADNPYALEPRWVCGICHPPPWPEEFEVTRLGAPSIIVRLEHRSDSVRPTP